jgi:cystathionine beta-lyase
VSGPDFDLTDEQLRASGSMKWLLPARGVVAAWVAEMDVAPCPAVATAVHEAVDAGGFGYPPLDRDSALPDATAAFLGKRFGWEVDPVAVVSTGDVMAGVMLVLNVLCEPGPVVVPVPAYPPFLAAVPLTGHELALVPCIESGGRPALDLEGIAAALAAGARTVLLANPHNPLGRAFTVAELEGLRDVVLAHRARVISDEVHSPLVLPGSSHVPYASVEGTAGHVTTLVAASKAFNLPGLKCAQIITSSAHDLAALRAVPPVANHGVSSLGVAASIAAYTDGIAWLDGLLEELAARRELFGELIAVQAPHLTWTPPEATYLAWVDARASGVPDPRAAVLARGGVLVSPGRDFGPGYEGFIRVNLATSAERLERIVAGLTAGLPAAG